VSIALGCFDGDFIAQPVCRRLIDKIWLGGDWSLLELKRFYRASWSTTEFYDYICARHPTAGGKGKGGRLPHVDSLLPLYREVADPAKMRRVPLVQFMYNTLLNLLFIFLSINKIVAGAYEDDVRVGIGKEPDNSVLGVFILGNVLYEVGQFKELGFKVGR
jgi:hypothetical protein